jgi:SAM-dependent methyltransferase
MGADYVAHVEANPYTALYEAPGLRALLPPVAGLRVLDAGCGGGRTSAWLVEQGAAVVGIDASEELLTLARERLPAASFVRGDLAEPLPFEDDAFDLVVAGLVMHYLRDWAPPLRELRRALRPGGALVRRRTTRRWTSSSLTRATTSPSSCCATCGRSAGASTRCASGTGRSA